MVQGNNTGLVTKVALLQHYVLTLELLSLLCYKDDVCHYDQILARATAGIIFPVSTALHTF